MNLFHTHVSRSARQYDDEVLRSGNLSESWIVKVFEQALARELGLCNPVCVNSGTSALHLALILAGVKPGDEVILPPQTFVATGMAVLMCGATPVFADVEPDTGNIDMETVLPRMNGKTTALICVHWAGLPCDMVDFSLLSSVWDDVHFIEDAAHALGATYRGEIVGCGKHSSATCFSFQSTKHLTTGDGGVYCNWRKENAEGAKKLRWFGIDREQGPSLLGERPFELSSLGFKYNMTEVDAAIGLGNLEGFKDRLARRQANGTFYREQLANVPGLTLTRLPHDRSHAYYCFPLLVERRDDFARMMKSKGIPVSVVCSRIDRNSVFGGRRDDLPGIDHFDEHQINLPCHEALSDNNLESIADAVKRGW